MPDLKVKVGVDKSGFTTGLAEMENSVKGFGTKVGGILAGAFAFDKIIQGFSSAIDKGDQLQDLANRFGVAASSLQEIGNAASTSGAGLEDVASAMNKLAKNAGAAIGGNEQMAEAFNKIGLSVEQLQGMTPQDLFMALSKAVASGTLGMQDFAIAQELAGKGAAVLMETLRMGPEVIAANGQAMGVWTDETIAKLSEASDAIKTFQNTITIAFGNIAQFAMPLINTFHDIVQLATMLGSASVSALSGDFAGAAAIAKEAGLIKIRRDAEEARSARKKTGRVFDTEGQTSSAVADKALLKNKQELQKAEEALAGAIRDRESAQMDATQKLGRAQAELLAIQSDINILQDNTVEKINKKAEAERKVAEILGLQESSSASILKATEEQAQATERATAIKEKLQSLEAERAGPRAEIKLMQERAQKAASQARETGNIEDAAKAQELANQLQKAKEAEFRAAKFDDESASRAKSFVDQIVGEIPAAKDFGMIPTNSLRDIPSSTEAQRTQPVKLENPPNLQGVLERLDKLIANAGVFS